MAMRSAIEASDTSNSMSKMAFVILPALADEMVEEMSELDEPTVRIIMAQIGSVIAWIGHGDNAQLPDSLRDFAEGIQPTVPAAHGNDAGTVGRTEVSVSDVVESGQPESDDSDDIVEAEIVS
jgi:hypothetical protein